MKVVDKGTDGKILVGYYVPKDEEEAKEKVSLKAVTNEFKVDNQAIIDPRERLSFKLKGNGLRKDIEGKEKILLKPSENVDKLIDLSIKRRSYRKYDDSMISLNELSGLLSVLYRCKSDELPIAKALYGSAGSLYPVQVYMYIKENRVEGIKEGIYYYNPLEHSLNSINNAFHLEESFYPAGNKQVFEQAAFSIFLIADLAAIKPLYGVSAKEFSIIESGLISQLLEETSIESNIGLCQIGSIEFENIREAFNLSENHLFIHNIVGGKVREQDISLASLQKDSAATDSIVKLIELSKDTEIDEEQLKTAYTKIRSKESEIELVDALERAKFKLENKGIRTIESSEVISLDKAVINENSTRYFKRASYRKYMQESLSLEELSDLLSCLRGEKLANVPFAKHRYASAGSLYPVQLYLYVKKGKVNGLKSGIYYYDYTDNSLVSIVEEAVISSDIFPKGNNKIFEDAGFAIFMIAQVKAIAPLYPKDAYEFCMLEAGEIAQLLEMTSVESNIGLCQIGNLEFEKISNKFALDDGHVYLHCILGGKVLKENKGVSYQSAAEEEETGINEKLESFLRERIPQYMIPNIFVELDHIPLNNNGKIDRKNLPDPDVKEIMNERREKEFVPPNTELEKMICDIWKESIGVESIGINDNFFELGGNSMQLIKAYNNLKSKLQKELTITVMFEYPTVSSLCSYITNSSKNDELYDGNKVADARISSRARRRKRK